MVRFEDSGSTVSIMTFADASSCVMLNSLPALSYAVMLNATGPFDEFCKTEMVANANVNVYQNSTEGVVSFNITTFDLAGNSLTVNQTQLNSPNITIDRVNPTLSNLTIYSNNRNTSLATLGDTLNITITVNEDLSSANITLLDATYAMSITDTVANASIIVDATHADGNLWYHSTLQPLILQETA